MIIALADPWPLAIGIAAAAVVAVPLWIFLFRPQVQHLRSTQMSNYRELGRTISKRRRGAIARRLRTGTEEPDAQSAKQALVVGAALLAQYEQQRKSFRRIRWFAPLGALMLAFAIYDGDVTQMISSSALTALWSIGFFPTLLERQRPNVERAIRSNEELVARAKQ